MYVAPENFMNASKSSFEAALAIAQVQFAAIEKFASLNFGAAKAAFDGASEQMKSVLQAKDPQDFAKIQSAAAQPSLDRAVAYARGVYDVASAARTSVAKVAEAHGAEINRAFATTIDGIAKNAPAGSEVAVNAMKSAFAAFNSAYDGMNRAAKQAAEVVEGNFAQAADVTRTGAKGKAA